MKSAGRSSAKSQPDLKLLATFLAVVRRGSMAEAATELGYVPSAVSQHIAALERELGVELIVRRPGSRLILTAAGRSLAQAAETLFDATARFQDAAHAIAGRELAELRVGVYPSAMTYLLPRVLATLRARRPGPRIRLVVMETDEGVPRVRSGDLDLLVAYRYLPEDPPAPSETLTITALGREPLVLVAGGDPVRPRPVRLADCLEQEWVSGHPHNPDRRLLHRWAGELGIAPRVTLETEDLHSMLAMIRAGLAVGLIPATLLGDGDGDGDSDGGHGRGHAPGRDAGVDRVVLPPGITPLHREILAVSRPGARPPVIDELVTLLTRAVESVRGAPGRPGGQGP
ncbi:LysR family transcriptional regulator [Streptomyces griseiscabiei]|uniref:LysR family transcriptional regulator n=1 Tax=Streptomyces griseiscabiei TaxID=2993540 RepID=A0ABU4L1Q0_9ACTN|nr:LysR family transcriptional regulator [Streptomyces griseiscabiei]MBZ3906031.1 LysR family transcriptional regulator [Streptomyces griseiscabiei]MDX2909664.1 LysR family transcriptional regulator [Streptomyces griseiscabiei]